LIRNTLAGRRKVCAYIKELHASGCPINTAIVIATGVGIVKHCDSSLFFENSGHISLTKDWAKYLLHRMNFVTRRSSSAAKVSVTNFVQLKSQFLYDIQSIVEMEDIPSNLRIKLPSSIFLDQFQTGQWLMKGLRG